MATALEHTFFENDSPHGHGKRLIYKKYLQAYIPIMLPDSEPGNKLTIVDGFAGVGRYEEYGWPTEIEKYGSPIIALHVAIRHLTKLEFNPSGYEQALHECEQEYKAKYKALLNTKKSKREIQCPGTGKHSLMLIFVEADKSNYKKLVKNILHTLFIYGLQINVKESFENGIFFIRCDHPGTDRSPVEYRIACAVYHAEFKQIVAPQPPSLAFIDPYGFSQTPWNRVREYVGYRKEVFLNLMSSYINRFISQKPEQIAELFGCSVDRISDLKKTLEGREDKIVALVDEYQARMKMMGEANYTVNFEMRGMSNQRLYHLVFATNHYRGLEEMKEAMNRGTQEANTFGLSDYKIMKKMIPVSFSNDQRVEDVAEAIFKKFKGLRVFITTVEKFILFDTLYVYRKKPLGYLEKNGKMKVVNDNERRRRYTFADHTDWLLDFGTDQ